MSTHDAPSSAPRAEEPRAEESQAGEPRAGEAPSGEAPSGHRGDGHLTASDVKTYATLAHVGTVLVTLVFLPLAWAPALALYLVFRRRDQGGLLRRHLAQAVSFAIVLTIYALVVRYGLDAFDVADDHGWIVDLVPVAAALVALYPCARAVQAVQRLAPYTFPRPLAWIPLD